MKKQTSPDAGLDFSRGVAAPSRVLVQQVDDESVLLNLANEEYFGLDPVGTRMWRALIESPTLEDAHQRLLSEFDVEPDRLRSDLAELVSELLKQGLLELS